MSVKEIVQFGESVLTKVSKRIEGIDKQTIQLAKDLCDTLYNSTGVGLAAPQIGISKRMILIDLRDGSDPILLINPKITEQSGKEKDIEGCLSYPGYEGIVERPEKVKVVGFNLKGEKIRYSASGLLARAFCHEIDHLDGVLYIDRAEKVYKE